MDAFPGMPSLDEIIGSANNFTGNLTSSIYADAMGFYHAVDWREPWLLGLAGFHAFVWTFMIVTRHMDEVQMVLLVALRASPAASRRPAPPHATALTPDLRFGAPAALAAVGIVYGAETLNRLGGEHWETFAGHNYFDKRGVFISVVFSTPMLCASFVVLLNALRNASRLLIQVKTKQIKSEMRAKKKAEKKAE